MRARLISIGQRVLPVASAAVLKKKASEQEDPRQGETWRETEPYWNLTVRILRASHIPKLDLLSESDCYVSLLLPTASSQTYRTRTAKKSRFPVWNETFHFRVCGNVKNVLELSVCDEDLFRVDCSTVLYDLNNLSPGMRETKAFALDPTEKDELLVEFEMEESKEQPGTCITNGVLVAEPFTLLEVKAAECSDETAQERPWRRPRLWGCTEGQDLVLKLSGPFEQKQVLRAEPDSGVAEPVLFHFTRDQDTQLEVHRHDEEDEEREEDSGKEATGESGSSSVPLRSLPLGEQVTLSVPVGQEEVDLQLKAKDCSVQPDVRLGFDIPVEEKRFLEKRSAVASRALQELLHLPAAPPPDQVPVVAVVGSGGGTRAMTGLCGSLTGLQTLGVLDAVSYITGVSGSTWAMSSLYADPSWSEQLQERVSQLKQEFSKNVLGIVSPGRLLYYHHDLQHKAQSGQLVSFIDFLGLGVEYLIFGKENYSTLSSQQRAVVEGQNPYPIYTAVNMKNSIDGSPAVSEWCEFTPYEVGIPKYGGFVRSEDFGSEFYMGHLIKRHPETRISYLLGIWSSVISFNLRVILFRLLGSVPSWITGLGDDVHDTDEKHPHTPAALDTYFIEPVGELAETLDDLVTNRPIISKNHNFLHGLRLLWDYNENDGFLAWRDAHLDSLPNLMTPWDAQLHLVDSGFAVNSGFPPVLRPQRRVDLVLSFNYSWNRDQFRVLRRTAQYCTDHHMPFPQIDFASLEQQPLRECYLFKDERDPRAPIVLHFPLINASFREHRAPGVRRVGEEELRQGQVDVESSGSPYRTKNLTYEPEDFQRLADLTAYNVTNNREAVLLALRLALEKHAHNHTPEDSHAHNHTPEDSHAHKHTPEDSHAHKHTPEDSHAHKHTPEDSHAHKHTPEGDHAHNDTPEGDHAHNNTSEDSHAHKHTPEGDHAHKQTPEDSHTQKHTSEAGHAHKHTPEGGHAHKHIPEDSHTHKHTPEGTEGLQRFCTIL